MRVLVCGGRDYNDYEELDKVLNKVFSSYGISCIIEGDAKGADKLAGQWADKNNIPKLVFPADWKTHGKAAGHIRNKQMLVEGTPDIIIAFPGGNGTANMRMQASEAGLIAWQPLS